MNRRQFLTTTARATGGLCAGLSLVACSSDSPDRAAAAGNSTAASGALLPAVGLQLYTIRSVMGDDFRGAMKEVAKIGYDEVEFAGYYDRTPGEITALLKELDLTAPATHIPLQRIREAPTEVIETANTIGHRYVVCPYLAESERSSLDDYRQLAEEFSAFGKRCSEAGLQFAYHNHDFEFVEMNGTRPFDLLLAETNPEHVKMELDLYWIVEAGFDPLTYIEKNPARYPLCHVKDRGPDGSMTPVGEGTLDFAALFRAADFQHYFVEHDNPKTPMQSIRTSHHTLRSLKS